MATTQEKSVGKNHFRGGAVGVGVHGELRADRSKCWFLNSPDRSHFFGLSTDVGQPDWHRRENTFLQPQE